MLALAMDGASPALLRRWAADGVLPNLARLIGAGAHGVSRGLEHFFVGSTWPSLYTGTSPADHGHHSLIQLCPGRYDYHAMADRKLVKRTPFWEHMSRAGRRVAILDVPLSALSQDLNGIQTVEWGSHDAVYGFRASTRELEREIESSFGAHPLGPSCDGLRRSAEDYEAFVSRLVAGVERKTQLTLAMLRKESWDFCVQVFTESHCAGHQCWHVHDPAHPAHDAAIRSAVGDPLERVYRAIDRGIGEIRAAAGDETTFVVFSAHGMSYWYGAQLLLNDVLIRLGVAAPLPPSQPLRRPLRDALLDLAGRGWRRLPQPMRERLMPLRRRLAEAGTAKTMPSLGVDAARSLCFPVYNGLVEGGIRLNLAGREPNGRVQPGAEADAFYADLRRELLDIVDERTGHRLVRDVLRTRDVAEGEHLDDLPDILVVWSDEVPTGSIVVGSGAGAEIRAHSPRIGVVEGRNSFGRTGEHRPDGFGVFVGPGIPPGPLPADFSILDYAPTFATLVGVEIPGLPGRSIFEITACAARPVG
ncbi:MAG TPA: alkaline phosphatase family protein [Gammaproteobacteria bacterium]|nr:alkaline phosphatase family protein [Gammaproteobacteria bacterium]